MKRVALVAVTLLLCAAPLHADSEHLLVPDRYDLLKVLPQPPAPGSPTARAEIAELRHDQATSTPAQLAAAAYDDAHEDGSIFAGALGPGYDMRKLPATAVLLHIVVRNEAHMSSAAKKTFHRDRPWIVDPSIKTCSLHMPGPTDNSYPSGHASVGYAMAVVLASLMPSKAKAIMARAQVFAENRIVCGYHFRSDIVAGKTFGTFVANELMRDPAFQPQYQAAAAELRAAHLAP